MYILRNKIVCMILLISLFFSASVFGELTLPKPQLTLSKCARQEIYTFDANSPSTFVCEHNWLSASILKPDKGSLCMHVVSSSFSDSCPKIVLFEADSAIYTIKEVEVFRNGKLFGVGDNLKKNLEKAVFVDLSGFVPFHKMEEDEENQDFSEEIACIEKADMAQFFICSFSTNSRELTKKARKNLSRAKCILNSDDFSRLITEFHGEPLPGEKRKAEFVSSQRNWFSEINLSSNKVDMSLLTEEDAIGSVALKYQSYVINGRSIATLKSKLAVSPQIEYLELENLDKWFFASQLKDILSVYKGKSIFVRSIVCYDLKNPRRAIEDTTYIPDTLAQFSDVSYEYVYCRSALFASALSGHNTRFVDSFATSFFPREHTEYPCLRFSHPFYNTLEQYSLAPALEVVFYDWHTCTEEKFSLLAKGSVKLQIYGTLTLTEALNPDDICLKELRVGAVFSNMKSLTALLSSPSLTTFKTSKISGLSNSELSNVFDKFLERQGKQTLELFLCTGIDGVKISSSTSEDFLSCWRVKIAINKGFKGEARILEKPENETFSFEDFRTRISETINYCGWTYDCTGIWRAKHNRKNISTISAANALSDAISEEYSQFTRWVKMRME